MEENLYYNHVIHHELTKLLHAQSYNYILPKFKIKQNACRKGKIHMSFISIFVTRGV